MHTRIAISIVVSVIAVGAHAQEYPTKPVKFVVPFSPAGATDVLGRIMALKLSERWSQSGIVENRPGASGTLGAELVAKGPTDGYTLLVAGVPHTINVSLYHSLRYDLVKDFAPISPIANFPSLIALHPSLPAKSVKELIALAKA